MPPKERITEQAIVEASLSLVRAEGLAALHARNVGKRLGCSVQPIFHKFSSMESLKEAVHLKANLLFEEHLNKGLGSHSIPFLGMGLAYINFARTEKELFKFLFMSDKLPNQHVANLVSDEQNKPIVAIISQMTGLDFQKAEQIFLGIWLMVHGIASMMATNECTLDEAQIETLLKHTFTGLKHEYEKGEQSNAH
nr:TetR-like C-terminal domain-containing protein [uncultured Sphaerochaeta sp.]